MTKVVTQPNKKNKSNKKKEKEYKRVRWEGEKRGKERKKTRWEEGGRRERKDSQGGRKRTTCKCLKLLEAIFCLIYLLWKGSS